MGYLLSPDPNQESRANAARALPTLEIFQFVSPGQLWYVAKDLKLHGFSTDTEVIRKGEIGTSLFISVRGKAKVEKSQDLIFELPEGAVLGEFAALDNEPRSARVVAPEGGIWYELEQKALFDAVQGNPELALAILGALGQKVKIAGQENSLDRGNWLPSAIRSLGLIQRVQLLSQVPLFSYLDSEALLYLSRGLGEYEKPAGAFLFSEEEGLPGIIIGFEGHDIFDQARIFDRNLEGEGPIDVPVLGGEFFAFLVGQRLLDSLVWTRPEVLSSLAKPYLEVLRAHY